MYKSVRPWCIAVKAIACPSGAHEGLRISSTPVSGMSRTRRAGPGVEDCQRGMAAGDGRQGDAFARWVPCPAEWMNSMLEKCGSVEVLVSFLIIRPVEASAT